MNSRFLTICAALGLGATGVGCGGDDSRGGARLDTLPAAVFDPADPQQIEMLPSLSAPHAYAMGSMGLLVAGFASGEVCTTPSDGGEPVCMPTGNGCPAATETADGVVIEGNGCTTEDGDTWNGRVVLRGFSRDAEGDLVAGEGAAEIVYEGLGSSGPSDCPTSTVMSTAAIDGTTVLTADADGTVHFDVDLTITGTGVTEDCEPIEDLSGIYEYRGTVREEGERKTWNGSGRFGTSELGVYEATTENEVLDSTACEHEALSGTTTVTAGSDVVVITYDGATDCEETSTATWSYNGTAQGELEGVECSASLASRARPGLALGALGGALLLAFARRRRR